MVQTGGGQLQALADAQRQRCGRGVGNVRQIKLLQGFFHRRRAFSAHLVESGVQIQIAAHAQFFIQRKRLRHIADTHFRIQAARVYRLAQQRGGAFGRFQQAGQHFHGGGLAAAVAAEKAENLAFLNGEADMVHGGEIAETLGQPVRFHRGRRSGIGDERSNVQTARTLLFLRRQHFDVGLFQHISAVIRQHGSGRLVFQQPACVHRQQPLKTLRLFNIGSRHNHSHTRVFPPQIVHQRPKLAARQRVHARGRFVQNQQIGAVHQRATQTQLLLHPARELARRPVGKRREAGRLHQPRNLPRTFLPVQTKQPRVEVDILIHRQGRIQVAPQTLRHKGDAVRQIPPHVLVRHIAAQHFHPSVLNHLHTRHQREQRRFAHAVRPDQTDRRAFRNVQRHTVKRKGFAVAVGKVLDGNGVHNAAFFAENGISDGLNYYSGLNLNQDKATKPQTVQIVRQGEATPYWFKVNPLYLVKIIAKLSVETHLNDFPRAV